MMLQVHDELLFEIPQRRSGRVRPRPLPDHAERDDAASAARRRATVRRQLGGAEALDVKVGEAVGRGPCLSSRRSRRSGGTSQRRWSGARFAGVEVRLPKQVVAPTGLTTADLIGKRIEALRRRAKFLIFDLSDGLALVFHLRLAGQLVHRDAAGQTLAEGGHPVPAYGAPLPHKSTHVIFRFDDGSILYLTDIRQFGRVWILPDAGVQPLLDQAKLGPEPLDAGFTAGRVPRAAGPPPADAAQAGAARPEGRRRRSATSTPTRSSSRAS